MPLIGVFQNFFNNGHERTVKAKKNILGLLFLKGTSIAISFLLVPLTIHYINPTQYGIWLTLGSIIGWFSYFDVGFGHGLRNKFAEALANSNAKEARIYVSTTYFSMSAIMGVVLVLFLAINPFLNWANILNADQNMSSELGVLALIVFVFFCIQFIFQLIGTIMTANHDPAKASLIQTLGSLISLIIIFILTKTTQGSLLYLGIVLSTVPVVVLGAATLWFFTASYKQYAPSIKFFRFQYIKDLLGLGIQFFIINISVLIMLNTDNIVITQLLGPEKVTVFNVTYKLFTMISMVYIIIGTPLWSAYTEAYTKGDFNWIKNTLKATQKVWGVLTGLTVIILIISPWFFELWLGDSVQVPFSLSIAMSTYVVGYIWMNIYTFLLNGLGKIRLQLYVSISAGIIYIPLVIILGKVWGLEGITYLSTFFFVTTGIIYSIQVKKLINNSAEGIWGR
ncbi:oligosaccharide flippase family protein [Flavobacteriaceae bacterium F89]|uniref:Oligosaccharide flippase family protein n=1 Tax=Cerina litoralis TaxID=2874477 RepID=A0AAE3ETW3_9FLAO|nr:oligosaccharide flippase family protein [Cerina litoralis]MCG2459686.1 oligosaccharide flippase family protein [Cerina litoralis]